MYSKLARWAIGTTAALSLFGAASFAQASSLTQTQISAIIGLLQSFGADQTVISNVQATLNGQAPTGQPTTGNPTPNATGASCLDLPFNLSLGSTNHWHGDGVMDVTELQQFLGVNPSGQFGPLTKAAVTKWQSDHGISAIGVVGPTTRMAMACQSHLDLSGDSKGGLSGSPAKGAAPLTVNFLYSFDINAQGAASDEFMIDFGDGTQGQMTVTDAARASHTYGAPGTYTAKISFRNQWATGVQNPSAAYKPVTDSLGDPLTQTIVVTGGSVSNNSTATIDQGSLNVTSGIPTITGTAPDGQMIALYVSRQPLPQSNPDISKVIWGGDTATAGGISLSGRRFSAPLIADGVWPAVSAGTYYVGIYSEIGGATGSLLTSGTLTVTSGSTSGTPSATIDQSSLVSSSNSFQIGGTYAKEGAFVTVVVISGNYSGSTDWNSITPFLPTHANSGYFGSYSSTFNTGLVTQGHWVTSINNLPQGAYKVLVYSNEASPQLLASATLNANH